MAKKKAGEGASSKAAKTQHETRPNAIPGTPSGEPPAGTHGAPEQPALLKAKAHEGPVNVITDSRGQTFDPELHAAHADGVTPHVDSFGHFILKQHHYDGAKKSHYGDTHRHA